MRKLLEIGKNKWFLFIVILTISALFRLPLMQYVEFKGDEALNLLLATRSLFHHAFLPAGVTSSAGILNFPLINYLLFPITIFTLYPPTISFVIALLNVLAIGGFFLLFSKYHGKLTAFLASCIIALSPWTILYSRKIWAQDFLLPLSLPLFLSIYKILDEKKKYWLLFGLSSMLLLQIHQLAILFPFFIFIGLLLKKSHPNWKLLFTGIVIGLMPTIPYFYYMVSSHFIDLQLDTTASARFTFHDITTFLRPLQIVSIGNFHTELGDDFAIFAQRFHNIYVLSKLTYLAYILLPIGIILFWVKNRKYRFFAAVSILICATYFIVGIEPLMHYFILLVPFFALFIAFFIAWILQKKKLKPIGVGIVVVYLLSLSAFDYGFLSLLSEKGGLGGEYGAGYITSETQATLALKKFEKAPNYKELELFYFAPREYFHGYMPLGRLLFPYDELKKNELAREKQFIHSPTNPLLATEIFAYYTQSPQPSWSYVVSLKEKSRQHPAFNLVYQPVLNEYLSSHLKRLYDTPDFFLLYPQHWKSEEIDNGVILSDDNIAITVSKLLNPTEAVIPIGEIGSESIAGKITSKILCEKNNMWCGTFYTPMLIRSNYYVIEAQPISEKAKTDSAIQKYGMDVLHEVTTSLLPLQ